MKIKITLYLIIGFCVNINAQEFDTLFSDLGGMTVFHSEDWKKIVEQGGGAMLNVNYKKYDENGILIEEMKVVEYGKNHYQTIKWVNGKKVIETYGNEGNKFFMKNIWNHNGELIYQYQCIDDESTTIEYYNKPPGNIYSIQKLKLVNIKKAQNFLEIESKYFWTETIDSTGTWVPNGEFIKFYPNGKIKEKGTYLQSKFKVFKSKEDFEKHQLGDKVTPKYIRKYAKDGEWNYFNEIGEIETTENYKNGNLLKKKN